MILKSALLKWFEWSRTLAIKVLVGESTVLESWEWIHHAGWAADIIHVRCALNFWYHDGVQIRCSQLFTNWWLALIKISVGKERYVPPQ